MIRKSELGNRVKELGNKKGIPISKLEALAGYSAGMCSRWAAAKGRDDDFTVLTRLTALADSLDVSIDELIGHERVGHKRDPQQNTGEGWGTALLTATADHKLIWARLTEDTCDAFQISREWFSESLTGRALADAWWSNNGDDYYILAIFCDDIQDMRENMECELLYYLGHGLAPTQITDIDQTSMGSLYLKLRTDRALFNLQQPGCHEA